MSHLWAPLDSRGRHGVLRLEEPEYALPLRAPRATDGPRTATLVRLASDSGEAWVMIAVPGSAVRVNGIVAPAGLVVLDDRDELRVAGSPPLWFSTESIARVEAAPVRSGRALRCPRCSDLIEAGTPAVRCPNCGVWHHQNPSRPCFTYENAPCAACRVSSELDGGFRWSPEEL